MNQLTTSRRLIVSQLTTSRRLIFSQLTGRRLIVSQLTTSRRLTVSQLTTSRRLIVSQLTTSRRLVVSQLTARIIAPWARTGNKARPYIEVGKQTRQNKTSGSPEGYPYDTYVAGFFFDVSCKCQKETHSSHMTKLLTVGTWCVTTVLLISVWIWVYPRYLKPLWMQV